MSKGYAKTLAVLESETSTPASAGSDPAPRAPSLVQSLLSNTMEDMYVQGIKNGDGSQYEAEYKVFTAWVSSSLDVVKPHLQALSFALFVQW